MGNAIQNAIFPAEEVVNATPIQQASIPNLPKLPRNENRSKENETDYDYVMKVILIGDGGSGKSALISRFTIDQFSDAGHPTIGIEFRVKTIEYQGLAVKLQIWDTAGPERFRAITGAYYRGSHALLICFSVANGCDEASTQNLERWQKDVIQHTHANMERLISFVGMKVDLSPTLLYDPWQDARLLLPAIRPCVDPHCEFAALPVELVYHILWCFLDVSSLARGYRGVPFANGVPVELKRDNPHRGQPIPTREEIEAISAKHDRPVYLTSSKLKIGVDELFTSVVAGVFETYDIIPRMTELEHRMLNPLCVDVNRKTRSPLSNDLVADD